MTTKPLRKPYIPDTSQATMINVGNGNYINERLIVAVTTRFFTQCYRVGGILDFRAGEKTRCIIILSNGQRVLSSLNPDEIYGNPSKQAILK